MDDGDVSVELRNCQCGSTLGVDMPKETGLRVVRSANHPMERELVCTRCGREADVDIVRTDDMMRGYCPECEQTGIVVASDIWDAIRRGGK
jgi:hypothetical protein